MLLPSCIPVAWVTPPVELQTAIGPLVRPAALGDGVRAQAAVPVRATLSPLQLFPDLAARPVDFGAGYQFMPVIGTRYFVHGPHLELAWLTPIGEPAMFAWLIPDAAQARVGVHLKGHALFESSAPATGTGTTLQLAIDGVSFSATHFESCGSNQDPPARPPRPASRYREGDPRHPFEDTEKESVFCGTGYAWGETGLGMYVETSYARLDGRELWFVGVGFKIRIPASLGVGFVAANF